MGLAHCPLCLGLAVLSAVRFSAHALILWQLRPPSVAAAAPAVLQPA